MNGYPLIYSKPIFKLIFWRWLPISRFRAMQKKLVYFHLKTDGSYYQCFLSLSLFVYTYLPFSFFSECLQFLTNLWNLTYLNELALLLHYRADPQKHFCKENQPENPARLHSLSLLFHFLSLVLPDLLWFKTTEGARKIPRTQATTILVESSSTTPGKTWTCKLSSILDLSTMLSELHST